MAGSIDTVFCQPSTITDLIFRNDFSLFVQHILMGKYEFDELIESSIASGIFAFCFPFSLLFFGLNFLNGLAALTPG